MATKIMFCTCKSNYQDKEYGNQQRVHNEAVSKTGKAWRCTVCGNRKETSN